MSQNVRFIVCHCCVLSVGVACVIMFRGGGV